MSKKHEKDPEASIAFAALTIVKLWLAEDSENFDAQDALFTFINLVEQTPMLKQVLVDGKDIPAHFFGDLLQRGIDSERKPPELWLKIFAEKLQVVAANEHISRLIPPREPRHVTFRRIAEEVIESHGSLDEAKKYLSELSDEMEKLESDK